MTTNAPGTQEAPAKETFYALSPEAIEISGRSPSVVFGSRLCEAALAKLKSSTDLYSMSYKELRKLLRNTCGDQDGYLSPQQPVLETVLRILLVAQEDKLSLTDLHRRLSELWMSSPWPRHISVEAFRRVLDNAVAYGIVAVGEE